MNGSTLPTARANDRVFYVFNAVLSSAALSFLAYILMFRRAADPTVDLRFLPAVNASLNATAACLLAFGWIAIKRGARKLHQYLMVSAFAASSLFLVCYLTYHYVHGDTKYPPHAPLRPLYLLILATHILLSITVVPLSLTSFYLAWRKSFRRHRTLGRFLVPIWLYVSITGVLIFFLLRHPV